ncbi:MAG TPA: hypothetical protein VIA18_21910, partial [Polyangia bacterium]|nr:hypothetical protein [Polyangia bacterium]
MSVIVAATVGCGGNSAGGGAGGGGSTSNGGGTTSNGGGMTSNGGGGGTTSNGGGGGTTSNGGGGGTPVGNSGPFDRIGYFAQWGIYGRAFPVKSVVDTGEADKLTVINYAFENIDPVNFTCLMATKASGTDGNDPSQ